MGRVPLHRRLFRLGFNPPIYEACRRSQRLRLYGSRVVAIFGHPWPRLAAGGQFNFIMFCQGEEARRL